MGNFPLLISGRDKFLLGSENRTDAMGVLAVWTARGRDLVPHLTATSRIARGFQILVETLRLWDIYQIEYPQHAGRLADFFLLVEQAFGRTIGSEHWGLPGNRRIAAREESNKPHISLSDSSWHLLGSQIQNGTWGTYLGAAQRAGLVEDSSLQLSIETHKHATERSEFRSPARRELFPLVYKAMNGETVEIPNDGRKALIKAIKNTYHNVPLANHLHQQIIESNDLCRQLTERLVSTEELHVPSFLRDAANNLSKYREPIENALRCEQFLSVVESIFYWLCASKGESVENAVADLPVDLNKLASAHKSFANSGDYGNATGAARHKLFRDQIVTANRVDLARSVLRVHKQVSSKRGRSAWVWESDQGLLSCDESFDYPTNEQFEIGVSWRNDYYLGSLRQIAQDLHQVRV